MRILIPFLLMLLLITPAQARDRVLDIQEVVTPNGITFWLVQDETLPIVSIKFSFRDAGANNISEDKQGLSRLLSNTMDEGAGELDSQAFQKELSDHSIKLSFSAGRDHFEGELKTLVRYQDKAFNLLKQALNNPRFDEEPVNRMREANISRIKSNLGQPSWIAARLFNDKAYEGHPYALNGGGTISTLESITPQDLEQYRQNHLTKDKVVIGVTGDIAKDQISQAIDSIFATLPEESSAQESETTVYTLQNQGKIFLYEQDIPQTIIQMALPAFSKDDPDYYALILMNQIFGAGGFGSRLMETAREKEGLTYGIYSGLNLRKEAKLFTIGTSTKNETVSRMLEIIEQESQKIAGTPVTKEELEKAKSYLIGSMPLSLTTTGQITSIVRSLQKDNRPINHLDTFESKINAVTQDDIQRVAQRIFSHYNPLIILVGKPENIEGTILVEDIPNAR